MIEEIDKLKKALKEELCGQFPKSKYNYCNTIDKVFAQHGLEISEAKNVKNN